MIVYIIIAVIVLVGIYFWVEDSRVEADRAAKIKAATEAIRASRAATLVPATITPTKVVKVAVKTTPKKKTAAKNTTK